MSHIQYLLHLVLSLSFIFSPLVFLEGKENDGGKNRVSYQNKKQGEYKKSYSKSYSKKSEDRGRRSYDRRPTRIYNNYYWGSGYGDYPYYGAYPYYGQTARYYPYYYGGANYYYNNYNPPDRTTSYSVYSETSG